MRNREPSAMPDLDRRAFLRIAGAGAAAYAISPVPDAFRTLAAADAKTQSTARMAIFIFAQGGMSHLDTFDIKEGPWTPDAFDVAESGGIRLPRGLFPKLSAPAVARHIAVVRSVMAWTESHGVGEYWMFANQEFNPAFLKERPHVGSVVALEYAGRRRSGDALPDFVALNGTRAGAPVAHTVDNGFLPARYAPFYAAANPEGETERMTDHPAVRKAFTFSAADRERYGSTGFGNSCLVARNLALADAGTAYVHISGIGWDHHDNLYRQDRLPNAGRDFDTGLANLITDLAAAPGRHPTKTALDEALIVVMGEFGRTPPSVYYRRYGTPLNQQGGRDHYKDAMSVAFVGGGVKGGRLIGATDRDGTRITDRGWSGRGPTRPEDIYATVYSALGIDWTKTIADTPSGRVYRYTPLGDYGPINELFQ